MSTVSNDRGPVPYTEEEQCCVSLLIDEACAAEEIFSDDELEERADAMRAMGR